MNFMKFLLLFVPELFLFQFSFEEYKECSVKNYNFSCCFIWMWKFVTLKEEGRLRVFKSRVLRYVFEPKEEKVTGG